jgi:hypothetical protein
MVLKDRIGKVRVLVKDDSFQARPAAKRGSQKIGMAFKRDKAKHRGHIGSRLRTLGLLGWQNTKPQFVASLLVWPCCIYRHAETCIREIDILSKHNFLEMGFGDHCASKVYTAMDDLWDCIVESKVLDLRVTKIRVGFK